MNMVAFTLGRLLFMVPAILVMVGCIVYVARRRSLDGILMLIGNVGGVVVGLVSTLSMFRMMNGQGPGTAMARWLLGVLQGLGILCSALFAVGFLLMALHTTRKLPAPAG